jgi:hypothetical protein
MMNRVWTHEDKGENVSKWNNKQNYGEIRLVLMT